MRATFGLGLTLAVLLVSGCKKDPATPEYWEKAIKSGRRAQDRARVVNSLRKSEHLTPALAPLLHAHLASDKPEVKTEIAQALGDLGHPSSVQPLTDAIDLGANDTATNRLNREIANSLGRIRDPAAVPPLMRMLKAKDGYVQVEAIAALGAHRAKAAVEPLMAMAADDTLQPLINRRAVQALGEIGDARAIPTLVRMLFKQHKARGDSFYGDSSFSLYQIGAPAKDAVLAALQGQDRELLKWAQQNQIEEAALYAKSAQLVGDLKDRRGEAVLLERLSYRTSDPDLSMLVRMTAADALGRLRTDKARAPIAALASDERVPARERYVWALARIGGREALPALEKAAMVGVWEAREQAMAGLSLLGDERELPLFDRLKQEEAGRTAKECEQYDVVGCSKPEQLVGKRVTRIGEFVKRLEAAQACKADAGCWTGKLDAKEATVRERAALELGRSGDAAHAEALVKRLSDPDPEARAAIIHALDALTEEHPEALAAAKKHVAEIDKQIDAERSKTDYLRVNEDLRRLSVKLHRKS